MTTKQLLATGAIALGLTGTGTALFLNQGSTNPAAPTNLRTLNLYATSTTIAWDAATDATSHEVWVTDLTQTGAQTQKIPVVAGTTYTAVALLPAHIYRLQVYSVLDQEGVRLLSTTAAEKNSTTAFVIIEDVVEQPPTGRPDTICPLTCSTMAVDSPGIVRWSAFTDRDYHKIRIRAKNGGTLLAQAVLERNRINGVLRFRNFTSLLCGNTSQTINPPASLGCATGVPALSCCGSFPHNGQQVAYRIEADIDKCVVQLLPPASMVNYTVEAERCTPPSPSMDR